MMLAGDCKINWFGALLMSLMYQVSRRWTLSSRDFAMARTGSNTAWGIEAGSTLLPYFSPSRYWNKQIKQLVSLCNQAFWVDMQPPLQHPLPSLPQQTQNIYITFVQCWTNVEDVGPTLYKCYTNVLCLLGLESGMISDHYGFWSHIMSHTQFTDPYVLLSCKSIFLYTNKYFWRQ